MLKGAAATGLGLGVASSVYLPTAFGRQEPGKVVFWTTHSGLGFEAMQKIGENYNAMETGHTVEIVQRPPSSSNETDSTALITAVRSGEGPDVYLLDRFIVGERAGSGLLEDITPLMEAAGDNTDLKATFAGFAAEEATYSGGIYALPFDSDLRALFYNVKMLEEAGADMAAWDKANGPMTFDSIVEILQSLDVKDDKGAITQAGFVPYSARAGTTPTASPLVATSSTTRIAKSPRMPRRTLPATSGFRITAKAPASRNSMTSASHPPARALPQRTARSFRVASAP